MGPLQQQRAERVDFHASSRTAGFTPQSLPDVAEDIATRDIPARQKVNVLRAMVRALAICASGFIIESGRDVEILALIDPDEYERLLRAYWALLGASRRKVA